MEMVIKIYENNGEKKLCVNNVSCGKIATACVT